LYKRRRHYLSCAPPSIQIRKDATPKLLNFADYEKSKLALNGGSPIKPAQNKKSVRDRAGRFVCVEFSAVEECMSRKNAPVIVGNYPLVPKTQIFPKDRDRPTRFAALSRVVARRSRNVRGAGAAISGVSRHTKLSGREPTGAYLPRRPPTKKN
jgi:hypothetical protein